MDLKIGSMYPQTSKPLFLADERQFAKYYGRNCYLCKIRNGLKEADLCVSYSPEMEYVHKKYGEKTVNNILLGKLWTSKSLERELINHFFQSGYDYICLYDSNYADDDNEFFGAYIINNPHDNVLIVDEVY